MKNKVLFVGGYPSPLLNGLKCANCGSHHLLNGKYYEAMGKNIPGHLSNIVSFYFVEDFIKKEFSIWKNDKNDFCFGVAFYKANLDNQSYRYYNLQNKNISKYDKHKAHLIEAYSTIFEA